MAITEFIPLIASGVTGLVENLWGTSMEEEADKKRAALGAPPKYDIPQSQIDSEQLARIRTRQEMPEYSKILAQIDANAANQASATARVSGSQYGAMAGSGAAQANRKKYLRQLGIASDVSRSQAEQQSINATASGAQYEQMQFEYNEWLPWQIAKNEIAAIRGVGQQQIMSGLDTAAAAGIYGSQLLQNNQQQGGGAQPSPYMPYNYGSAGQQINQMGQNQVYPSTGLGTDPYAASSNTGFIEPWMTQSF